MVPGHTNVLVFDLVGVLFSVNVLTVLRYLGWRDVLLYMIRFRKNPLYEGLQLLDKMRCEMDGEFQTILSYKKVYLPNCFLQWQLGTYSTQQVYDVLHSYFHYLAQQHYFYSLWHQQLMMRLIRIIVCTANQDRVLRLEKTVSYLIYFLKKKEKYKLYIITNIDQHTYVQLQKSYTQFFSLFDGIITSFQAASIKPEPTIFHYFLNKYHLVPQNCFFVDDQGDNIATASGLGMKTMLCTSPFLLCFKFLVRGML